MTQSKCGEPLEESKHDPREQSTIQRPAKQRAAETKTISLIADQIWQEPLTIPEGSINALEMQ